MPDTDPLPNEDDVLRRMLATPPKPHKPKDKADDFPKVNVKASVHKGG